MTEINPEKQAYYVLHGPANQSNGADGSVTKPFPTLDAALAAIGKRQQNGVSPNGAGMQHLDLICLDRPGSRARDKKAPRYQYYIESTGPVPRRYHHLQSDNSSA